MDKGASKWTIPNVLSGLRLLAAPVMLACIYTGCRRSFVALFIAAQITDILDGFIARRWKLESDFGARLDSYADIGSYVTGFCGIIRFHPELFRQYGWWLGIFAAMYILNMAIAKTRFSTVVPGLHLYSSKVAGYLQGSFLVVLFAFGLLPFFFYVMITWGYLSTLECILINSIAAKPVVNAKGIYQVIKEGRWQ